MDQMLVAGDAPELEGNRIGWRIGIRDRAGARRHGRGTRPDARRAHPAPGLPANAAPRRAPHLAAATAQPVAPVVGMAAQVLPGQRGAVEMQHVEIRGGRIPVHRRFGSAMTQPPVDSRNVATESALRELRSIVKIVIKVVRPLACQDRLAPKRCWNRPNATAAQPENGAQQRTRCRQPAQSIMTVCVRVAPLRCKNVDSDLAGLESD